MTAWGVVAACAIGGGLSGPLIDLAARRAPRARDPGAEVLGAPSSFAASSTTLAVPAAAAPAARPFFPGVLSGEVLVISAVMGGACALTAVRVGAAPELAAYCVLVAGFVAVSITDLRAGLVPRRLLYPTLLLVAAALLGASASEDDWHRMLTAVIGGAIAFVLFGAVWWISPKAMGFGDVRLAGLCGGALAWLGFAPLYLGFLAACVGGTLMGLVTLTMRGKRRFPFAPALAAGTMFGVLWGGWLGNLWLHPR